MRMSLFPLDEQGAHDIAKHIEGFFPANWRIHYPAPDLPQWPAESPIFVNLNDRTIYVREGKGQDSELFANAICLAAEGLKRFERIVRFGGVAKEAGGNMVAIQNGIRSEKVKTAWPQLPAWRDLADIFWPDQSVVLAAPHVYQRHAHHAIRDVGYVPGNKKEYYKRMRSNDELSEQILQSNADVIHLSDVWNLPSIASLAQGFDNPKAVEYAARARYVMYYAHNSLPNSLSLADLSEAEKKQALDAYINLISDVRNVFGEQAVIRNLDDMSSTVGFARLAIDSADQVVLDRIFNARKSYHPINCSRGIMRLIDLIEDEYVQNELDRDAAIAVSLGWPKQKPKWFTTFKALIHDDKFILFDRKTGESVAEFDSLAKLDEYATRALADERLVVGNDHEEPLAWAIYRRMKGSKTILRVATDFVTKEEAEDYLEKHWQTLLNKAPQTLLRPAVAANFRAGPQYRIGSVDEAEVVKTFGLRALNWGNHVSDADRQASLNAMYDAFCDLADVLALPRNAIGLNGTLAITIGARGRGGINAPAAHYEPHNKVINLTRDRGTGLLAHEWAHALDHFIGRVATGTRCYATEALDEVSDLSPVKPDSPYGKLFTALHDLYKRTVALEPGESRELSDNIALAHAQRIALSNADRLLRYLNMHGADEPLGEWQQARDAIFVSKNPSEFCAAAKSFVARFRSQLSEKQCPMPPAFVHNAATILDAPVKLLAEAQKISHAQTKTNVPPRVLKWTRAKSHEHLTPVVVASLNMDAGRSRLYYSTPEELFARTFERLVVETLRFDMSDRFNAYLANVPIAAPIYPSPPEIARLHSYWQQFRNALKDAGPHMCVEVDVADVGERLDARVQKNHAFEP